MKRRILSVLLASVLFFGIGAVSAKGVLADGPQGDYYYFTDRYGNEMMAPVYAFASYVVEYTPGTPWTNVEIGRDPKHTLGWPYETKPCYILGGGGSIVLGFDIAIYDGEGIDIYIFEYGASVESTKVEVSDDLKTWYAVGVASGLTAGVDLSGNVPEGKRFRYVRLTDLFDDPGGPYPGADIMGVSVLNYKAITSDWSAQEIDQADDLDLVPKVLEGKDMTRPITRLEFAAVCVKVFESMTGTTALPATRNPFADTEDIEVLKAYNAGITNGVSPTEFAPDRLLDREQCATMLTRVFKRATMPGWTLETDGSFTLAYDQPGLFADDAQISDWARDSVYFMAANGIINGMGENRFVPRNTTPAEEAQSYANATREQALAIALRMVKTLNG